MWNFKIKKGFTLIEVMCSITIFYICFIFIFTIEMYNIKLNKQNTMQNEYISYVDTLKNILKSNYNYMDIKKIGNKKCYISKDNLTLDILNNSEMSDILIDEKPNEMPYVQLEIRENEILNINIELCYIKNGKWSKVHTNVYKSKYQ